MTILCQPAAWPGDLATSIGGKVDVVGTLAAAERLLVEHPDEHLVVVGPDIETDDVLRFAAYQRVNRPSVGVVLIRAHVDVAMLTRALQAGVREVVPADQLAELAAACERSRALSRSFLPTTVAEDNADDGHVITVFSAKGGCGKTTVAVNLALALARGGANSVCLVDLDLAFGDVAINLQLDPARTITDAVPMAGRLDETGARSVLTPYANGVSVLLAPVTPGDAEKVPATLVAELLAALGPMFDYVVVDTPSQFSEHVLNAMDVSKHHVLLTTPDVPALKNLRLTLDMLDLLSYHREMRAVVLNRSDSKVGLTAADVERVIRGPIGCHVPSSRDVPVSINRGTPIVTSSPSHGVSQAIAQLANGILAQRVVPATQATPATHAGQVESVNRKSRPFARLRQVRR